MVSLKTFTPVISAVLLGCACGRPFCDAGGLDILISNPPLEVVDYTVLVEFEDRSLELDCSPNPPHGCETSAGPWTLAFGLVVGLESPEERFLALSLENGDDFTAHVPRGQVRVVLSSPTTPEFGAEHTFEAEVQGSTACEWAQESWDLAA